MKRISASYSPAMFLSAPSLLLSGGIPSHSAIIAREYRVPAVVTTGNATQLLRDDKRVTVNGQTGSVEVKELARPRAVRDWPLRSVQVKLLKIGGRLMFHLAEVAVSRSVFAALLERIGTLALAPG